MDYAIHWFRRDLRVAGNNALREVVTQYNGKVLGIFCFDSEFLKRKDFSHNRFQFFLETLKELRKELKDIGGELLVVDSLPDHFFETLCSDLKNLPKTISWNRDYEPFARKRDEKVSKLLKNHGIEVLTTRDHLIIEPNELCKDNGESYQVFTPFSRKWLEIFEGDRFRARVAIQKKGFDYLKALTNQKVDPLFSIKWKDVLTKKAIYEDAFAHFYEENKKHVNVDIPKAGSLAAFEALKNFKAQLKEYGHNRDFPALDGTSRLSHFFKNGSLTTAQVLYYLDLKPYRQKESGNDHYFAEIIWREFYYHILYHHPRVEKEAFIEKYKDLDWENSKKLFEKWKKGETGYPIVDAGMRQLNTTGWMHNRVRMIVASFLVKDLLIDWKWGEQYFMEKLLDGDLAPNNGGWQWAASTGVDPQPYFRVFNPWLQGQKFDPDGEYIKEFVPELKSVSVKMLHKESEELSRLYIKPIVDHNLQRAKAIKLFKSEG